MSEKVRELCPLCIDINDVTEEKLLIREDDNCRVEKSTLFCSTCHFELNNSVTFKFKPRHK
jgi:hypothetical protein